jgi:hypothetical protein
LETLEFTMDAERYRNAYNDILSDSAVRDGNEIVCALWHKLMNAYIMPCGPRELNLPSPVRDRLLTLGSSILPPHPSELDDAVHIVYELMSDSVLVPFLESITSNSEMCDLDDEFDSRQKGTTSRASRNSSEEKRSPKMHFLPHFSLGRSTDQHPSPTNSDLLESGLSDDNGSVGSPRDEPMTPPTTPPTSDWVFATSPGALQRAIASSGWKRVSQKLGLARRHRSKRSVATTGVTSGVVEADLVPTSDSASSNSYLL